MAGAEQRTSKRVRRLLLAVTLSAASYWVVYGFLFILFDLARLEGPQPARFGYDVPMPYHVPKYKGGLAFRFAMAHDVIHERFARHGTDYYQRRNEIVRAKLQPLEPDDPARWPLIDDLGAGLDRVGKPAEAVVFLREKLAEQERQGVEGRELYTSYANLGTFLIHANFPGALRGNTDAIESFREGVDLIHKSVEVNPQAHYGREEWQAVVAEFFLAVFETPELLTKSDCIGNRLDAAVAEQDRQDDDSGEPHPLGFDRPHNEDFRHKYHAEEFYEPGQDPSSVELWYRLVEIRQGITNVGGDFGNGVSADESSGVPLLSRRWPGLKVPAHQRSAPFDEPMLGIIGMWREGGGANPHFALAIAETMLRVGQRRIAWTAYERAKLLNGRFSPDPKLQQFLVRHCEERQKAIAVIIGPDKVQQIAATFREELKFGQDYQADYHEFERQRIADGVDPGTEGFDKPFFNATEPIASKPGVEETYRILDRDRLAAFDDRRANGYAWIAAGIMAMLPVTPNLIRRLWARRKRKQAAD